MAVILCRPRRWDKFDPIAPTLGNHRAEPVVEQLDMVGDDDLHVLIGLGAIVMENTIKTRHRDLVFVFCPRDLSKVPFRWVVRLGWLIQHEE